MHTHERSIDNDDTPTIDLELFKMNVYRIKNCIKNCIKNIIMYKRSNKDTMT